MIRACIFDLDGTIADTVESIGVVGNRLLCHYGLPKRQIREYNYFAGDGADELVKRILKASGGTETVNYEEAKALYRKWFEEDPFYHVKPFDGIVELLEALKAEGISIAVFSNKPHHAAVDVVKRIFGEGLFDEVQGQTKEVPRKPSPVGALAIAGRLGVTPKECLYLGDTNTDMDTGKAAGMFTIGVTWGFRPRKELEEHQAKKIVDRPEEVLAFVKERNHAETHCQ